MYYLGNKAAFTSKIKAAIDKVDPSGGRLCDLFAGTGSVAAALCPHREVTTVDIQEYSRVLCSAKLAPARPNRQQVEGFLKQAELYSEELRTCLSPLISFERRALERAAQGDLAALIELLESPPLQVPSLPHSTSATDAAREKSEALLRKAGLSGKPLSTVTRYYGGLYFSFEQAVALDGLLAAANDCPADRDTYLAAVLCTASIVVNTVGKQFAQPIRPRDRAGKPKPGLAKVVVRDRQMDVFETFQTCLHKAASTSRAIGKPRSVRDNFSNALDRMGATFSVVYADPPYTRDHYSRFYHVLETMCLRDNPEISISSRNGNVAPSRGVYREERHQSPFCIRSQAPAAFEALLSGTSARNLPLVLSYSPHEPGDGTHPRAVAMDTILEIAKDYYRRVSIASISEATHNKLNSRELSLDRREHAEVLISCFC